MCELQCVSVLHDSLVGADMNHAFRLSEVKRETCPAGTSDFDRFVHECELIHVCMSGSHRHFVPHSFVWSTD